jgi:hypothetical protein
MLGHPRTGLGWAVCFVLGVTVGSGMRTPATGASLQSAGSPAVAATDEILVLRYFKIRKGSFPEIARLTASIAAYFDRAGARSLGFWQVRYPVLPGQTARETAEFDEMYLLNRYVSVEHWQASRIGEIERIAGTGPDFIAARDSLAKRQSLTLETRITVLQGGIDQGRPYFYPRLPK